MPEPTPAPSTSRPPFDGGRFRRLLGMYVLGVAIGCLLVGMMLNMKKYFRPPVPGPTPEVTPSGATPAPDPAGGGVGAPNPAPPAGS